MEKRNKPLWFTRVNWLGCFSRYGRYEMTTVTDIHLKWLFSWARSQPRLWLQTDLGFGDREQTGTCNRYTWNSSDSSAPKMRPRLFLAAVVKNKGSVLLLCMRCHSISRRKKHAVGGVSNFCLQKTNCTTLLYLTLSQLSWSSKQPEIQALHRWARH